jgi:transcriptional antiterminator RfaH
MRIMRHISTYDTANWYVIHTHPRQETRVDNNLSSAGIETLAPRIKKRKCNNYTGEVTYKIKSFFPNYIFARFDAAKILHKIRHTRGVHSVICCGTTPAVVDNLIIATIQSRMGQDGCIEVKEAIRLGDEVIVEDGPFKHFRGIFERETSDIDRVVVLLQTVSYQAHLVIEKEMLRKVGQFDNQGTIM